MAKTVYSIDPPETNLPERLPRKMLRRRVRRVRWSRELHHSGKISAPAKF